MCAPLCVSVCVCVCVCSTELLELLAALKKIGRLREEVWGEKEVRRRHLPMPDKVHCPLLYFML